MNTLYARAVATLETSKYNDNASELLHKYKIAVLSYNDAAQKLVT